MMSHRRPRFPQPFNQAGTISWQSAAVLLPVGYQDRYAVQTDWRIVLEWRQRAEQDGTRQQPWTGQEQCRRHDGTIGEADGDGRLTETLASHGGGDEISQHWTTVGDIVFVNRPVWKPMEEGIAPVVRDGSTNTKNRRLWSQFLGHRNQLVLISAGAMQ